MDIEHITFYFKDFRKNLWLTERDEDKRILIEKILDIRGFKLHSTCLTLDVSEMELKEAQEYYDETKQMIRDILALIKENEVESYIINK